MITRFLAILSFFVFGLSLNLSVQRLDAKSSFDVEVTHTSTRQIVRFSDSKTISLLTVPDDYQFNAYSSGQSCLETMFNYYQFPVSSKPYKEDFFFNDSDSDYNNFTSPEKLVKQALAKIATESTDDQRNAFEFIVKENLTNRELETNIDNEIPTILLITKGNNQKKVGYVIIVGYDNQNYYFQDPATFRSIAYIPKEALGDHWKAYIESENRMTNKLGIIIKYKNGRKREIVPTVRPYP